MSFVLARPSGFSNGTRLQDTELDTIQDQLVNAVDGYDGGTYTPVADIIIDESNGGFLQTTATQTARFYQPLSNIIYLTEFYSGVADKLSIYYGTNDGYDKADFHFSTLDVNPPGVTGHLIQRSTHAVNVPQIVIECPIAIYGGTVTSAGCIIQNWRGSIGAIGTPPSFNLKYVDYATGVINNVVTDVASSTYNATPGALVTIEPALDPVLEFAGKRWFATITGEAGANAQNGMRIVGLFLNVQFPQLRF